MNSNYCLYCMSELDENGVCPKCGTSHKEVISEFHQLPPGSELAERYVVGRVLGEGGFGITYIGCDTRLGLKVAIKEYYPIEIASRNIEFSGTKVTGRRTDDSYEKGKARFLREAKSMAKMDKQQVIVGVRDYFEENNTAYIVMEYIEGETLAELVKKRGGKMNPKELFLITEPIYEALTALHEAGLIHRDISPDNIMIEDGRLRLIDLGVAGHTSGNVTMSATITVKHNYAPIEQFQSGGQGPWTDIYALGATLYYCLTGTTPMRALDRIGNDDMRSPAALGANLLPYQDMAVMKALSIRADDRFRSAEEMHQALYTPPVTQQMPVQTQTADVIQSSVQIPVQTQTADVIQPPVHTPAQERALNYVQGAAKVPEQEPVQKPAGKKKRVIALAGGTAAALVLIAAVIFVIMNSSKSQIETTEPDTVQSDTIPSEAQTEPTEASYDDYGADKDTTLPADTTAEIPQNTTTAAVTTTVSTKRTTRATTTSRTTTAPETTEVAFVTEETTVSTTAPVTTSTATAATTKTTTITTTAATTQPTAASTTAPKTTKAATTTAPKGPKIVKSGKCGDNVKWTIDENGTVTISGNGKMDCDAERPFYSNLDVKNVVIEFGVTSISDKAFYGCKNMTSISIPNSVSSIGNDAFNNCSSLTSVTVPNTVTFIGKAAFEKCSGLSSMTLSSGIKSIEQDTFLYCTGLTEFTVPNGVVSIGYSAFSCCDRLKKVRIPASVTTIGDWAFYYCPSLTELQYEGSETQFNSINIAPTAFRESDNAWVYFLS